MLMVGVVTTTSAGPAIVADGLLVSWTWVVLLAADGPRGCAGPVAGERDRDRVVALGLDGDLPAVALSLVAAGAGDLAFGDRERVVAHVRVADPDVLVELGVERERGAAVVVLRDVVEAGPQILVVADGADPAVVDNDGVPRRVAEENREALTVVVDGVVDDGY